jgi:hypothetical protein
MYVKMSAIYFMPLPLFVLYQQRCVPATLSCPGCGKMGGMQSFMKRWLRSMPESRRHHIYAGR